MINILYKQLQKLFLAHYNALFVYHETVESAYYQKLLQNKPNLANSNWDLKFLYPMIEIIFGSLYGNYFIMFFEENDLKNSTRLSISQLSQNCKLMYHQILPRETWPTNDISFFLSTVSSVAIYAIFLCNPCQVQRYVISSRNSKQNVILSITGKSKF